jgi:RNA exonuclease 1
MDCEMSYTLGGMECVRVSVVDWFGNTVMDEIVKPSHPIVCFNTRFSGIQSIENGMTLDQVHKKLSLIASSKTILLGHSLENDLRCLRVMIQ